MGIQRGRQRVKQFLNITILEVEHREVNETMLLGGIQTEVFKLHYYNPFNKRSIETTFSRNTILFPDNLQDLNSCKIIVSLFHYPFYLHYDRNWTGNIAINLMMQLSNALNFSTVKDINMVCMLLIPWLISRILNFYWRYWKWMYTIQILLGSSTPQMPRKFLELVSLVIIVRFYFLQSSYIYNTFSNLQL